MCGTRIDKSVECDIRVGESVGGYVGSEGKGIGKSGCVEFDFRGYTVEYNAILSLCRTLRIAFYFFESLEGLELEGVSVLVDLAYAFDAEDPGLLQSLAMCPAPLQNIQRLFTNWCFHSSAVSFPSFPSFKERSGFLKEGVEAFEVDNK